VNFYYSDMKDKPQPKKTKMQVNEPTAIYKIGMKKTIRIFSTIEEENEYVAKERAMTSYDERMFNAEQLRRIIYNEYLLPNGKWVPIPKLITLQEPNT